MFNTRSGSGSQLWVTNAAYSALSVGQSLSVSLYFEFSGTSSISSLKLGFTDSATPTAKSNAYPNSGAFAYFSEIANMGDTASVVPECYGSNGTTSANVISLDQSDAATISSDSWYYVSFSLTKTDDDTFSVTCLLSNSTSSGVVGSTVATYSTTNYVNSGLDTTLYAFIGIENPGSTSDFLSIDNLTLTSDAAITGSSIPEPSSYALFAGAGALAIVFATRRRGMGLRDGERV